VWRHTAVRSDRTDGDRSCVLSRILRKANNGLVKKVIDKLYEANIILVVINHIERPSHALAA
jgi:hypothetical protein